MNKRQRKKQFKKLHNMNPKQYFIEKSNARNRKNCSRCSYCYG